MSDDSPPRQIPPPDVFADDPASLQAMFAAIVASSADAIVSKNLSGIIMSWNAGAERVFGYTAAEAIGRPVTMLLPHDRGDEEQRILGTLMRGDRIDHFETERVTKDGRRIASPPSR